MKLAVAGCGGRMGLTLVRIIRSHPDCKLAAGSEHPGAEEGVVREKLASVAAADLNVVRDPRKLFEAADAVIDFTSPESTVESARIAAETGKILIAGTTGLSEVQIQALRNAAQKTPIIWSGNMSLGVAVLETLIEKATALLGPDYDIEVDEMHHRLKKDAPSGTALMLARAAAKGRGINADEALVYYAPGVIGERKRGTIGMSVRRGGDVVGVHTVTLAGPGENLELTHRGFSRDIYAHGAVRAALWAKDKKPGLYTIRDVLGL